MHNASMMSGPSPGPPPGSPGSFPPAGPPPTGPPYYPGFYPPPPPKQTNVALIIVIVVVVIVLVTVVLAAVLYFMVSGLLQGPNAPPIVSLGPVDQTGGIGVPQLGGSHGNAAVLRDWPFDLMRWSGGLVRWPDQRQHRRRCASGDEQQQCGSELGHAAETISASASRQGFR